MCVSERERFSGVEGFIVQGTKDVEKGERNGQ